jgi:RsiW-degrading membrane proteinase PrsW (M82 family)
MTHARRFAWLAMVIADAGLLAWGAMAALAPGYLLGPGFKPILAAGYEGFTGQSWQQLMATTPTAAAFMTVLFRVYGAYVVAFGLLAIAVAATAFRRGDGWAWWALLVGNTIAFVSAMTYDSTVGAIGPFEMSEYLGLAVIWGALAVTAPFRVVERPVRTTG